MGFMTSATEIQERLAELKRQLDIEKMEWAKTKNMATSNLTKAEKTLKTILSSNPSDTSVSFHVRQVEYWHMATLIAQVGLSITDVHKRLANVEKAIEELSLRIKNI